MNSTETKAAIVSRRWASLRRFVATFSFTIWLGGLTFYALAVVPTGHQVLRSKVRQGFITQRVTQKLNWIGAVTMLLLMAEVVARRERSGWWRTGCASWLAMSGLLVALFQLHPHLDALLDESSRAVVDDDRFYALHRIYLLLTTVQWLAGAVHLGWLSRNESHPQIDIAE